MTASKKILLHLGKKKVKFEVVPHKTVFTSYDLAQTLGEKLDKIAKTLLVHVQLPEMKKQGKQTYLVVVPATYYVDLQKVRKSLKATKAELAPEKVMAKFGLKPGALSPFGSLRGLGVVVDKALLRTKDVIVGAESFTEHLRMKMKDLVAIEPPVRGVWEKKKKIKIQKKPLKKARGRGSTRIKTRPGVPAKAGIHSKSKKMKKSNKK